MTTARSSTSVAARRALLGALCAALVCASAACSPTPRQGPPVSVGTASGRVPYWRDGVTTAELAQKMNVTIPARAAQAKAAYLVGLQDDAALLAFTLPTTDVDAFVRALQPERPLLRRARPSSSGTGNPSPLSPYTHLHLREPHTLADVTEGPVCSYCKGDLNYLNISVHPLDAHTSQVYLEAAF